MGTTLCINGQLQQGTIATTPGRAVLAVSSGVSPKKQVVAPTLASAYVKWLTDPERC